MLEQRVGNRAGHFMPKTLFDSQLAALEPPQPAGGDGDQGRAGQLGESAGDFGGAAGFRRHPDVPGVALAGHRPVELADHPQQTVGSSRASRRPTVLADTPSASASRLRGARGAVPECGDEVEVVIVQERHALPRPAVRLFLNGDEEIGSPASRPHIERLSEDAAATLVCEAAAGPEGALKTSREGVGLFEVTVAGAEARGSRPPTRARAPCTPSPNWSPGSPPWAPGSAARPSASV